MESTKIPLEKYLSVAIGVAEACGLVIREVHESGILKT